MNVLKTLKTKYNAEIYSRNCSFFVKKLNYCFFLTALLFVAGVISYIHTPIEAFPDVTNTRARIITQWQGRSAEEVEKFIPSF